MKKAISILILASLTGCASVRPSTTECKVLHHVTSPVGAGISQALVISGSLSPLTAITFGTAASLRHQTCFEQQHQAQIEGEVALKDE